MKIKRFDEKLNESVVGNGIPSHSVWVIIRRGQTDINEIYLKKEEAEKLAGEQSMEYYNYYRKLNKNLTDDEFNDYFTTTYEHNKLKVISLDDAIDQIKDEIKDSFYSYEEGY